MTSGLKRLDDFLDGGLPLGAVSEWGAPLGQGGREIALAWVARATQGQPPAEPPAWVLWAHSRPQLTVYPPAWTARGVSLPRVRFACTARPVADLRPAFFDPFFRLIVLDAPRTFSDDDCAFLARQARANEQAVLVLRDFFLGPGSANVWARLRLNCWFDQTSQQHRLRVVRGLSPRQLSLAGKDL